MKTLFAGFNQVLSLEELRLRNFHVLGSFALSTANYLRYGV